MTPAEPIMLHLWVCEVCGHAIDERDMTPGRGCFGRRDAHHARGERRPVDVDRVLLPPAEYAARMRERLRW